MLQLLQLSLLRSILLFLDSCLANKLLKINHYGYILSKANRILDLLKRTFSMLNSVSIKQMSYVSLVRSQLSHSSHCSN